MKQAPSYIAHHLNQREELQVSYYRQNLELIRIKLCSRFRGGAEHQLWIHYQPNGQGVNAINAYYCTCRVGARTLGTCSHVAAILWQLGYRRGAYSPSRPFENCNILNASQ